MLNYEMILRPDTWRALAPALHVGAMCASSAPLDIEPAGVLAQALRCEGYIHTRPLDWRLPILEMAEVVCRFHSLGLPPVFVYLYDETWSLFGRLHGLLTALLGDNYALLPEFWAWYVDPATGDNGWAPHRDKGQRSLFADGTPKSLTVWLPLTDATPLNGCIYVVPADRDPTYNTVDEQHLRFELSDIRALPAAAGSLLAWTQAIIHWGARTAPGRVGPRISLSCEFQRRVVAPFCKPLLSPTDPPEFADRLRLVARQIIRYQHMYSLDPALAELSARLSESAAFATPPWSLGD
jgi:hypothetical protein